MNNIARRFYSYWFYVILAISIVFSFALAHFGFRGSVVREVLFWHFAVVIPLLLFGYGRTHGHRVVALGLRLFASVALAPSLLAWTVGLPTWVEPLLPMGVRNFLRALGVVVLFGAEAGGFWVGMDTWCRFRDIDEGELARNMSQKSGIPLPLARFMAFELGLWRKLLKRRPGGG